MIIRWLIAFLQWVISLLPAPPALDKCEVCKGANRGVPGAENTVRVGDDVDVVMCDYCHAAHTRNARDRTHDTPPPVRLSPEFGRAVHAAHNPPPPVVPPPPCATGPDPLTTLLIINAVTHHSPPPPPPESYSPPPPPVEYSPPPPPPESYSPPPPSSSGDYGGGGDFGGSDSGGSCGGGGDF